jgi:hypothetical protein
MSNPPRGGRRPGAGRPPSYTEPLLRKTVTLPVSYVRRLEAAGHGNLSDGIRLVLEHTRLPDGAFWLTSPPPPPHGADCPTTLTCVNL